MCYTIDFESQLGKKPFKIRISNFHSKHGNLALEKFGIDTNKVYMCEAIHDVDTGARIWTLSRDNEKTININHRFAFIGNIV